MSNLSDGISTVDAQRATLSGVAAVLIAVAILLPCLLLSFFSAAVAKIMLVVSVLGTSLWVAVDSSHLKVREYKSQVAVYPFVLFTASLGLWIVVFPVYLVVRSKIQAGQLPKTPNFKERHALYTCIAMWCILATVIVVTYFVVHRLVRIQ